ncbi:uncharacterized protein LOC106875510 [Argonauta hians]
MRFRRFVKFDVQRSMLLIVMAYFFTAFGMIFWNVLLVPNFSSRTNFFTNTDPLLLNKLFVRDEFIHKYSMQNDTKKDLKSKSRSSLFSSSSSSLLLSLNSSSSKLLPKLTLLKSESASSSLSSNTYFPYFSKDFIIKDPMVSSWIKSRTYFCSKGIECFSGEFAKLNDVFINPKLCKGRVGGENLTDVINQSEDEEYLTLESGFFRIKCHSLSSYNFFKRNHLNDWWSALKGTSSFRNTKFFTETCFTIAITRYEYVNFYHTMTDFYNAFLMLLIFKQQPQNVRILWIDAHPKGSLDSIWKNLFAGYTRLKMIKRPVMFHQLVWSIMGYNSPLMQMDRDTLPYVEEFRDFFLKRFNQTDSRKLDCSKLNVLFIWRRDYVAHPRNPKGIISRKVRNEGELIQIVRKRLSKNHSVRGIQIDLFTIDMQLNWISNTDILIGMHGAGMTHALFLPKHSGVIEFFPTYWPENNAHFQSISMWRNLKYLKWQNSDTKNEFINMYTHIPAIVMKNILDQMLKKICPTGT